LVQTVPEVHSEHPVPQAVQEVEDPAATQVPLVQAVQVLAVLPSNLKLALQVSQSTAPAVVHVAQPVAAAPQAAVRVNLARQTISRIAI
jgi:hypothetical protein